MSVDKKRLLILIPDGTGIKNYLLSDFIIKAAEEFEVVLAHNFPDEIEKEIALPSDQYKRVNIPSYKEPIIHKFYREAITYARLNYNAITKDNPTILINWRRKFKQFTKKWFYRAVEYYGRSLPQNYTRIVKVNQSYHDRVVNSNSIMDYKELLDKDKPDIVLTTHQRSVLNVPLFAAAKKSNIPSVAMIYSWDNMPKARIPFFSDYFFVWSDHMKQEFADYYPEIDQSRVVVTGTPQFEFYLDESLRISKKTFCEKHNLDTNRPIVCYSGDDRLTSPFDPEYLVDMAEEFLKIEESERPQIILRPSPADNGERFRPVLDNFPDISYAPADWFESDSRDHWAVKFPKRSDIKQLVNLSLHADAVVNVGSTMAHDFAMFNKPAFYLNYQPEPKSFTSLTNHKKKWNIKTIYEYQHFKTMKGLKPIYWVNDKEYLRLIPQIIKDKDVEDQSDQKKWRDRIIGKDLYKKASSNLVQSLLNIE